MIFEEFKYKLDSKLGLKSTIFEDVEGHRYLEYLSPTGVLLFAVYLKPQGEGWSIQPIGDIIPDLREMWNDD